MIGDIYLEKDINNEPRMILKDETGEEWVMSQESTAYGFRSLIEKKDKCWYFDEKNRTKQAEPHF
jgi:hypothetical protein